jgi:hypothetical protein
MGKGKQLAEAGEGPSAPVKKEKGKDKRYREDTLVAAVNQKTAKPRGNPPTGHFEKLLNAPCPNHEGPVKHAFKDCNMMKAYLAGTLKKQNDAPTGDRGKDKGDDDVAYPREDGDVMMIFRGSEAQLSRRQEKLVRQEVYQLEHAAPAYLKWSETPVTFDRHDHPDHIPRLGSYPLVVSPLFGTKRVHKVLMDRGSRLNVIYMSTLDDMGILHSRLWPSKAPFHRVVPEREAVPLGQIDLPFMFGAPVNFRTETLTFEVVGFPGTYHAVLGRPAFAKFMDVPNYTYLKLKMPGPKGIITFGTTFQYAYECDDECF